MIGSGQRHDVWIRAGHDRARDVNRVPGVGREHHIAGIDERKRHVADPIFGTERRQDLCAGVELDARPLAVPAGNRFPQLGEAEVGRIAMVGRVGRGLLQNADDPTRRRQVGVAGPE